MQQVHRVCRSAPDRFRILEPHGQSARLRRPEDGRYEQLLQLLTLLQKTIDGQMYEGLEWSS